jgi:tetratricopeptide (TPR) repeat protein
MDAVTAAAPHRHPWLDRLIAAPGAEVRALVEGTASVHPYQRAEPSDAAATLLFGLPADDPARKAFDQGALDTLAQYRAATGRADRNQLDRVALAALDLMTVVQRLTPRDTVIDLHRRFPYWNAWAETLVLDRGLDLRREYCRVLALTQDIAAEAGLAPRRLLPFWLDICGEAGRRGRYDESYLTVGLLGLRSLPLGEQAANEEAALHGLARWADAQRPAKKRFLREWHVLEGAFPRDPTFWADLVARVIASVEEEIARQTNNARKTFDAAEWWREDAEAVPGQIEPLPASIGPAPQSEWQSILDAMQGQPLRLLAPRIDSVIRKNEHYATRTGDTFYLVRTACNIGKHLLRGGDVPEQRAAKASELAQLALRFEGANVYAWSLWREALAAEGHLEAAELLGWETIRRFPEDPQWRNQLALLLADRLGRPQEVEALLRETLKLFPDNAVAYAQLANVVGRQSARLKEAIALLDAALKIDPTNQVFQAMKRRFERGRTSVPSLAAPQSAPVVSAGDAVGLSDDLAASARMRRALFRVRTATAIARLAAKREVEAILREDEGLAYARYVAAAVGIVEPTSDDSVPAAAYLAVAKEGTAEALQRFDARLQGLEGVVISLVGAARGDEVAATRLKAWMAEPANDLSSRDHSLRAIAARVAAPLPPDFVGDMLAASLGTAMAA